MDYAQIEAEEKRWRNEYPEMFTHPELKEGEVWVGDVLSDLLLAQVHSYRSNGVPTARCGKPFLKLRQGHQETYNPIFMNLHELIIANEECKKKAVNAPARP